MARLWRGSVLRPAPPPFADNARPALPTEFDDILIEPLEDLVVPPRLEGFDRPLVTFAIEIAGDIVGAIDARIRRDAVNVAKLVAELPGCERDHAPVAGH